MKVTNAQKRALGIIIEREKTHAEMESHARCSGGHTCVPRGVALFDFNRGIRAITLSTLREKGLITLENEVYSLTDAGYEFMGAQRPELSYTTPQFTRGQVLKSTITDMRYTVKQVSWYDDHHVYRLDYAFGFLFVRGDDPRLQTLEESERYTPFDDDMPL